LIAKRIMKSLGATEEDIYMYPKSDYMDGYMGQNYIIWDEFMNGTNERLEKEAESFIQMVNTAKFVPELPSVENINCGIKGTECAPKCVITLSNDHSKSLTSYPVKALTGRRQFVLKLSHTSRVHRTPDLRNVDLSKYSRQEKQDLVWLKGQFQNSVDSNSALGLDYVSGGRLKSFNFTDIMSIIHSQHKVHLQCVGDMAIANGTEMDENKTPEDIMNDMTREFMGIPEKSLSLKQLFTRFLISTGLPSFCKTIYNKAECFFSAEALDSKSNRKSRPRNPKKPSVSEPSLPLPKPSAFDKPNPYNLFLDRNTPAERSAKDEFLDNLPYSKKRNSSLKSSDSSEEPSASSDTSTPAPTPPTTPRSASAASFKSTLSEASIDELPTDDLQCELEVPLQDLLADIVVSSQIDEINLQESLLVSSLPEDIDQYVTTEEFEASLSRTKEKYQDLLEDVPAPPPAPRSWWPWSLRWFDFSMMIVLILVVKGVFRYICNIFANDDDNEDEEITFAHYQTSGEPGPKTRKNPTRTGRPVRGMVMETSYTSQASDISMARLKIDDVNIVAVPLCGRKFLTVHHWGIGRIESSDQTLDVSLSINGISYANIPVNVGDHIVSLPSSDFCIISLEHYTKIP
jgi:hypothetical protein